MTQPIPETAPNYDATRVIERPDGFYWRARRNGREYGPFATLLEAVQDMQSGPGSDEPLEAGETLEEAESEIGIAGYTDPETGELAEEQRPRLPDS